MQVSHESIGAIDFQALRPAQKREFTAADFAYHDCDDISENVLQETGIFVSAMQTVIQELINNEESIVGTPRSTND